MEEKAKAKKRKKSKKKSDKAPHNQRLCGTCWRRFGEMVSAPVVRQGQSVVTGQGALSPERRITLDGEVSSRVA